MEITDDKDAAQDSLETSITQLKSLITQMACQTRQGERGKSLLDFDMLGSPVDGCSFSWYSDISGLERLQTLSHEEVVELIRSLPLHLQKSKVPVPPFLRIPNDDLQTIKSLYSQWESVDRKMHDYQSDTASMPLTQSQNASSKTLVKAYESTISLKEDFSASLRRSLADARHSQVAIDELRATLQRLQNHKSSPKLTASKITESLEVLDFRNTVLGKGGQFLDYAGAQRAISTGSNIYVFYFITKIPRQMKASWKANKLVLFNLLRRNAGDYQVAAAQCTAKELSPSGLRITFYARGEMAMADMLRAHDEVDEAFAKCEAKYPDGDKQPPPPDRRLVRLSCPSASCSRGGHLDWFCYKCRMPLEYHQDCFYCKCGRADIQSFTWQCNGQHHGREFVKYRQQALSNGLKELESYKDFNILLLGETGVGKSTWVNAFVNYMIFDTLDDAMAHNKLEWVIPSSFSMPCVDESGAVPTVVQIGDFNDTEADGTRGDSATQKTAVYRIPIQNAIVRLIDTPGVGDVRGVEADRRNLDNILRTLNRVNSLHGIIILLKPNMPRLSLTFRFCVKELLTYLHRDAARNIAWGFTNTRTSLYTPGDTMGPLQRLLEDHTSLGLSLSTERTYCFDSEGFRYLAMQKQVKTSKLDAADFRKSWKRSVTETHRLLDHFATIEPHPIQSTLNIIKRTIQLNQDQVTELISAQSREKVLEESIHFVRIDIKVERLSEPRTVCRNPACVTHKDVCGVKRPIYSSLCHDPCYLTNVEEDVVGHHSLACCAAFLGKEYCSQGNCLHHWQEHMHFRWSQEEIVTKAVDPEIVKKVAQNQSIMTIKKEAITLHQARIQAYESELQQIRDAAAHFGLFLRHNSITPYNDAMIDYLKELIKEEKQSVAFLMSSSNNPCKENEQRLADLEKNLQEYQQRIKVLSDQVNNSSGSSALPTEEGIEELMQKLFNLQHWGDSLRKVRETVEWARASDFQEKSLDLKVNKEGGYSSEQIKLLAERSP
ncbi:hypothetical protein GGR56DRAFT_691443 [Xylariaceae sp. FL0804]|nr:hypothetical protein GGR56DRAFT_691443 [Xylariaceae sp. FL0804]